MKKKGFTLVELLAVIAILAILVIIALPNVMGMFNNAKKSSFETELKNLVKYAKTEWMQKSLTMTTGNISVTFNSDSNKITSLDSRAALKYQVTVDSQGKVKSIFVSDGTYWYGDMALDIHPENILPGSIHVTASDTLPSACGANTPSYNSSTRAWTCFPDVVQ